MKYSVDRSEILSRRTALTRAGLRPAFTNTFKVRDREQVNRTPNTRIESTTFRSPLISSVYHSVFCAGSPALVKEINHENAARKSC